jgi:hypothetical protein
LSNNKNNSGLTAFNKLAKPLKKPEIKAQEQEPKTEEVKKSAVTNKTEKITALEILLDNEARKPVQRTVYIDPELDDAINKILGDSAGRRDGKRSKIINLALEFYFKEQGIDI